MSKDVKTVLMRTMDAAHPLGKFTLQADGTVDCLYYNPHFKTEMEDDGIYTSKTGVLHPSDGALFMETLRPAFSNSSMMQVIDGEWQGGQSERSST